MVTSRDVTIQASGDAGAYVGIQPTGEPNDVYLDYNNGEAALNVDDSGNGGSGINTDGHTRFDDVFQIVNQGTQTVYVTLALRGNGDTDNTYIYDSDSPKKALSPNLGNPDSAYSDQYDADNVGPNPSDIEFSAARLEPGDTVSVGLDIERGDGNTGNAFSGINENLQVEAFDTLAESPASNTHTP